ncbi:MAG: sigma-54 dependent transcriptional regulator [Phycisphaerales bacterium]|jgi:transcriptional regulator with GAF, ATPase, and Fis domain|nr:sigma-54 dependent transcriptional regulator [Phycisphaerales bacterium]
MRPHDQIELDLWRAIRHAHGTDDGLGEVVRSFRDASPVAGLVVYVRIGTRLQRVAVAPGEGGPSAATPSALPAEVLDVLSTDPRVVDGTWRFPASSFGSWWREAPLACTPLGDASGKIGLALWRMDERWKGDAASAPLGLASGPLGLLAAHAAQVVELQQLRRSAEAGQQSALRRLGRESATDPIIGASGGLSRVLERVGLVAEQDVPVLLLGETGSGKEVVARAIHERSPRRAGPFLRVNCGAIPPDLVDSHLFGHERGSFTGATDQRLGWFERANEGTLFLDEIGELSPPAQVRLLRVVQEGVLERVGGQRPVRVDCRIIAATHRDLSAMVRAGSFREDLWYRLAVFPILIPPLRERLEDLPELVRHFAHRASVRFGLPDFVIDPPDLAMLRSYRWPGNIRELAAVIDRAALLGSDHRLSVHAALGIDDAPAGAGGERVVEAKPGARSSRGSSLDSIVRDVLERALTESRGKVHGPGGAAEALGVNPNTLRSRMRKLGLRAADYRKVVVAPHAAPRT